MPGRLDQTSTKDRPPLQPIVLRDYQSLGIAEIRQRLLGGARRVLYVLPTAAGKTVIFTAMVKGHVERGGRVLVLVHRTELVDQVAAALDRIGVVYGVIAPGVASTDAPAQIAMIQTILRRLERWQDQFTLLVADEAHHTIAASWSTVIASQPRARLVGVSATPERLDGRGLGELFDEIVLGPQGAELMARQYLTAARVFQPTATPDLSKVRTRGGEYEPAGAKEALEEVLSPQSAASEFNRLCPTGRAIGFAPDVESSKRYAAAFSAAGIAAAHVDGETPRAERKAAIAALRDGSLRVLFNVALFGEGVDVPSIDAVILLRSTASLAVHLQQMGRGLRPAPGKAFATFLDFAGNCSRHGLPDEYRSWTLDAKPRRQRARSDSPALRKCQACSALNAAGAHECAVCGADLRTTKERREIEMRLEEAKRKEQEDSLSRMRPRERWAWAGADERRLRLVARVSGYSPGWVWHRLREVRAREEMRA